MRKTKNKGNEKKSRVLENQPPSPQPQKGSTTPRRTQMLQPPSVRAKQRYLFWKTTGLKLPGCPGTIFLPRDLVTAALLCSVCVWELSGRCVCTTEGLQTQQLPPGAVPRRGAPSTCPEPARGRCFKLMSVTQPAQKETTLLIGALFHSA